MGIDLSVLPRWLIYPFLVLLIAFIAHRLAWHLAGLLLRPVIRPSSSRSRFFGRFRRLNSDVDAAHERRRKTLQQLIASIISVAAFITAIVFSLSQVVGWDTLLWIGGFLTAAFGFGARALISDLLAGFNIIFEDIFDVGEKIEIGSPAMMATGVVEHVSLRTTWVRAPSGELYVVPNGDIRILRNFSRGRFSMTNITLKIGAADLQQALPLLTDLGKEAVILLPNLLEPWQVISKTGTIGGCAELTLVAKAQFGHAADMRPHLLALVQERLTEVGIELVD